MIDWLSNNWLPLLVGINSVMLGAAALAKLTPNKWDDKIIGYVLKVLSLGLAKK